MAVSINTLKQILSFLYQLESFQSVLIIEEVQAAFNEMEATEQAKEDEGEDGNVPAPERDSFSVSFEMLEPELPEPEMPELEEPETEGEVSHVSSNLSEPGLCTPENPCNNDEHCRHWGE